MTGSIQLGTEMEVEVRVRRRSEFRCGVVSFEGFEHLRRFIHKIQHVCRVLAGMCSVQAGEVLHGLNASKALEIATQAGVSAKTVKRDLARLEAA